MMAAVILFIIICIGLYLLHIYMEKYTETNEHYMELAKFFSERELGIIQDNRYTKENHIDVVRRFFKEHPDKLAEAEKLYKKRMESKHHAREAWKKEFIMHRIFAYDYEEMLFQIFSDHAMLDEMGKWHSQHIDKNHLLQRISEIKNIEIEESQRIVDTLIEHCVLCNVGEDCFLSSLLEESDDNQSMSRWNIVSDIDMNLDKWMKAHGCKNIIN